MKPAIFLVGGHATDRIAKYNALPKSVLSAINNTYGKGINPECLPTLLNSLTIAGDYLKCLGRIEAYEAIQETIKNAIL